jgi:S1-C subfamily serine protease
MTRRRSLFASLLLACVVAAPLAAQEDLNDQLEKMTKAALRKVAPSVVQIQTQGGTDMLVTTSKGQAFRKAGPTTGVVVAADGYIISSAFNFTNNPTTILVSIPGRPEPLLAQRVANDRSRLLTLLKVDAKGLPVPAVAAKNEIREGQWAIALGRTLDQKSDKQVEPLPSVSVGIISALGRIWGKALQTDAKVSPINYGGPLVDIQGRVQGILIPASPNAQNETVGYEWYDSGIGFAIPMEDVLAVLPRLKEGKDLQRGILGIRMKGDDIYSSAPEIVQVEPGSAAAKAGLRAGDVIVELDGKPVIRMAQLQHILGPKYEGDQIALKYRRGDKVESAANLTLVSQSPQVAHPFLGILPLRDDPKLGVEVRYVYAKSPAERAGIKAGDRIVKYGAVPEELTPFLGQQPGRQQLLNWLNTQKPGSEIKLELARKDGDKTEEVTLKLDAFLDALLPDRLPQPASLRKALDPLETAKPSKVARPAEPGKKAETGFLRKTTADGERKYWVYVHEDYDPNVAHALVVWLHPPGKGKDEDGANLTDLWEDFCRDNHIIMIGPTSQNEGGWIPSEADGVVAATNEVLERYTIDRQRVVVHGMGTGGQMALYLAFADRNVFRGAATVGAVVTQVKDNVAPQRLSFFLAAGSLDPLAKSIADSRTKLTEAHYPALFREIPNRGREYLEEAQLRELIRWLDSLDRL